MTGLWGKKIGMTQVFAENKVVPVTVINIADWYITNSKTAERDGYNAIQMGCVRSKYREQEFTQDWLKNLKKYFNFVREVKLNKHPDEMGVEVGKPADFATALKTGDKVDAFGKSIGRGFAGVVKRHGFAGSPASHGARMGNRPGSMSWMRSQGRVVPGKRLPGHLGNVQKVIRNLEVVTIKPEDNIILIKGSVPGKSGSLIFLRKV